ncbi:MAG: M23 family metallopeptidase [Clostridia bacterium]|nr:M23 family metallopeptidase [Clostridia bacterium]
MKTDKLKEIFDKFYDFTADFGSAVIVRLKSFFISYILTPLLFLKRILSTCLWGFKKIIKTLTKNIRTQQNDFYYDFKTAREILKENRNADSSEKQSTIALLNKFTKIAFRKHRPFIRTCFNAAMPVVAAVVCLIVFANINNNDFALKVTYNDKEIGYIENEQVFRDAEDIIKERLAFGGQEYTSDIISQPKYKISVVRPNEITDSTEICEKIIENSDSGLITACGVYVDEKFICSVKNESDASSVFKNMILDYCKQNGIDPDDSKFIVDFAENVTYVQGLYSEKTIMTSEEIDEYIKNHKKSESMSYTMKLGDTVESVRKKYKLSDEQFYAINPSLKKSGIALVGTKVNVIRSIPFVNISVSETVTQTKKVKFKTIKYKTDALYVGTSKTVKEGKNGKKKVTSLITYINGVKVSEKEISSVITKEPVDEKVYVGTKPIPSLADITGDSSAVFIWPTIGVDYVTSPFGYRMLYDEPNFHRGLDISGAEALGKPIIASAAGTVEQVTSGDTGYGYSVLIDHGNGIKTRYGHCLADSIVVQVGDKVEQGQTIAQVGSTGNSTGPHLHFEIMYNGAYANPLDYLTKAKDD